MYLALSWGLNFIEPHPTHTFSLYVPWAYMFLNSVVMQLNKTPILDKYPFFLNIEFGTGPRNYFTQQIFHHKQVNKVLVKPFSKHYGYFIVKSSVMSLRD